MEFSERINFFFLFLFFLTVKVLFLMYANTLPDEAYYWLWSKKIGFSYFDHPPLVAWVQAILLSFFDNKYFAIRVLPFFSLGIVLTIMLLWQKLIFRKFDYGASLKCIVLFLAFPVFSIFFSISFPDYLLITLLFTSSFCLFLYFQIKRIHYWYLAILLFSLALLTKYNAVLYGIGILLYILYYKNKINSPSYPHIIASIFIIGIIQTPVLFWNLGNDFASFSFHLNDRLDEKKDFNTVLKNTTSFLFGAFLAFSPIFIFNLWHNFLFKDDGNESKNFLAIGKFVLVLSTIFCVFMCLFTNVLYYWMSPAIVLLIPFLNDILRSKMWQYLHIFYGMFISLILLINTSIYPISALFGKVDRETAIVFGWERITAVVGREKRERGIKKVVFSDYRLGSLYIFYSGDFEADVVMEERRTQFDVWRKEVNSFGMKTLIIADNDFPIGQKISSRFEKIEFVRDIKIRVGNRLVKKYQVFLGTNT